MQAFDVIIVGSGPAGTHAALPLAEAGLRVCMIDGGYAPSAPPHPFDGKNFEDIRRGESDQWRAFLGEDFSGIPVQGLEGGLGGGMTSGNRAYVTRDADALQPLTTENAIVIQSLAEGGLGAAWGAACAYLPAHELTAMGLPADDMNRCYDEVTRLIGVSGPQTRDGVQPAARTDLHASLLLERARKKQEQLLRRNIAVLQPHSALLTQDLGTRKACAYADMDYYADPGRSVYRPQYTLEELKKHENFTYLGGHLAEHIATAPDGVTVRAKLLENGRKTTDTTVRAKRLVMAAGALNTGRVLLRSLCSAGIATSFVGKPHAFSALVHPRTLGKAGPRERVSLCQLLAIDEAPTASGFDAGCAQLYSYKSLLLFRLLGSVPLPVPEAMKLLSLLSPSLLIADIRFPGLPNPRNVLTVDAGGKAHVSMQATEEERADRARSLGRLRRALRSLGAYSVKTLWLPEASTSHHAGTAPVSEDTALPLSTDSHGRLRQAEHVYVADASIFKALPAKPHTLTIMANARRVAGHVLASLGA